MTDDFKIIYPAFIKHLVEFQATHRLTMVELVAHARTFDQMMTKGDHATFLLYTIELVAQGITPEGNDTT